MGVREAKEYTCTLTEIHFKKIDTFQLTSDQEILNRYQEEYTLQWTFAYSKTSAVNPEKRTVIRGKKRGIQCEKGI